MFEKAYRFGASAIAELNRRPGEPPRGPKRKFCIIDGRPRNSAPYLLFANHFGATFLHAFTLNASRSFELKPVEVSSGVAVTLVSRPGAMRLPLESPSAFPPTGNFANWRSAGFRFGAASRAKREAHGKIESPGSHVGCSVTTRGLEGCSWERTISPPPNNLARPRSGPRERDHSICERMMI